MDHRNAEKLSDANATSDTNGTKDTNNVRERFSKKGSLLEYKRVDNTWESMQYKLKPTGEYEQEYDSYASLPLSIQVPVLIMRY